MKPWLMRIPALLIVLLLAPLCWCAETQLKLAGLFTDRMIPQRGQAVPVWGCCGGGGERGFEVDMKWRDGRLVTKS